MVGRHPRARANTEGLYSAFTYAFIGLVSLLSLLPFLYVIALSLTGYADWLETGGFVIFPAHPTLMAYERVLGFGSVFTNSLLVSVERTILGVMLELGFTLVAGYVVSRRMMPGRRQFITILLIPILFSGGLIPGYLIVQATGLLNRIWALVIPGVVDTFGALVFKQFFENVPAEIEQSAQIDGASEFTLMTRIFIPMCTPVVAALAMFQSVGHWNAWFDALLYISDSTKQPLQLVLRQMLSSLNTMDTSLAYGNRLPSETVPLVSIRMALTVVGIVPIIMIYPLLQKYFVKGVYTGSVKE